MKAVFLNTSKLFGGVEKNLVVRAAALQGRGHDVYLVVGSGKIVEYATNAGIRHVRLLPCSNDYDPIFFFRFLRVLLKIRPDVLFLNTKRDFWRGGIPGRLARIRRIVGYWGSNYNIGNEAKINFVFSALLDKLIINSYDLKERLLSRKFAISAGNIEVIHNGFDSTTVPPDLHRLNIRERFAIPPEARLLGTAGRLVKFKRFELAFEVLSRLNKTADVHLVIAGAGPELDNLKSAAAALNVSHLVHFTGEIRELYTTTFFDEIEIFVFCSENEGLANVLIEAAYFNRFAVVLDSPGMTEIIKEGISGKICGNLEEMTITLRDCLETGKFSNIASRPYVAEKFSVNHMVSRTESVFFE